MIHYCPALSRPLRIRRRAAQRPDAAAASGARRRPRCDAGVLQAAVERQSALPFLRRADAGVGAARHAGRRRLRRRLRRGRRGRRARSSRSRTTSVRAATRRSPRSRSRSPTARRDAASARGCSRSSPTSRARRSIETFFADVLPENRPMLDVFLYSGFDVTQPLRGGVGACGVLDRADRDVRRSGRGALAEGGLRVDEIDLRAARRSPSLARRATPATSARRSSHNLKTTGFTGIALRRQSERERDRRRRRVPVADRRSRAASTWRSSPCRPTAWRA